MKNGNDLQRFRLGPVNEQVGVDREEPHRLVRQVLAPMPGTGDPRQKDNSAANDLLDAIGDFDCGLPFDVTPNVDQIERGLRRKDVAPPPHSG